MHDCDPPQSVIRPEQTRNNERFSNLVQNIWSKIFTSELQSDTLIFVYNTLTEVNYLSERIIYKKVNVTRPSFLLAFFVRELSTTLSRSHFRNDSLSILSWSKSVSFSWFIHGTTTKIRHNQLHSHEATDTEIVNRRCTIF